MASLPAAWRKAPLVLVRHPSVFVAVFVAALLAGLAASSAPFVTTAAASEALKNRLAELTSFATGLQIQRSRLLSGTESAADLRAQAESARLAGTALRAQLGHVAGPFFTTETASASLAPPVALLGPGGGADVVLMARTGALGHVTVLSMAAGPGVWISDIVAHATGVEAGGSLRLTGLSRPGDANLPRLRIKGIYRALAHEAQSDYWTNFFQQIYPQGLNAPVPASFVFLTPGSLDRLLAGSHAAVTTMVEFPISPSGLTLPAARALAAQFADEPRALAASTAGHGLGCGSGLAEKCTVISSLSSAVILANENASAVTPAVTLLSDLGTGVALTIAAAAGVFLVRRRRAEAALLYARGEHVGTFAARGALEALVPALAGGMAGFALAYALTTVFAPAGSISSATAVSGALHAAIVLVLGLLLLVTAAAVSFLGLYDTGSRNLGRLRSLPWELIAAGAAAYLLLRIRAGGGLSTSPSGAHAPTLAVFLYPLLLVAACAGLAARIARMLLRRGGAGSSSVPAPVYLAVRRLAAARGLVIVLVIVSAVSLGSLFYVETLAGSLDQTTLEKAYMATGSDASAIVQEAQVVPRSFPYPVTLVQFANQAASLTDGTTSVDVMLVDPETLERALHWQGDWGPSPAGFLTRLERAPTRPLPVIATADLGAARSLVIDGTTTPIRKLAVVHAFPFVAQGIPLVVTSYAALNALDKRARLYDSLGVLTTYAWAKGPPVSAGQALTSLDPAYPPQTIDTFLHDPEVVLATRTFGYMRLIALASGLLTLLGLVLYLQARQRSQAIASTITTRMGFGPGAQTLSLTLELGCLLGFAGLIGGFVAVAAAAPVIHRLDPLPIDPPSPIFVVPFGVLAIAAAVLLAVAILAGVLTSWLAARSDVSEALRVA